MSASGSGDSSSQLNNYDDLYLSDDEVYHLIHGHDSYAVCRCDRTGQQCRNCAELVSNRLEEEARDKRLQAYYEGRKCGHLHSPMGSRKR